MTNRKLHDLRKAFLEKRLRLPFAIAVSVVLTAAISCTTVHRAVVELPMVPGANYTGSKDCEQCHDKIYKDFISSADHARLMTPGPNSMEVGCESCHGPASLHADSGGEVKPPFAFSAGRSVANSFGAGLAVPTARSRENVCLRCHADVRGQFNLPSHHPVPEARMSCTDCHSPHKGSIHAGGGTSLLSETDACLKCHALQKGPHVFEHEAVREGCTICHTPHGSINAKLLTVRDSNLCLKCHFQQPSGGAILIGGSDHTVRLQRGTCWSAGCHEAVHGSRVDSSLRF